MTPEGAWAGTSVAGAVVVAALAVDSATGTTAWAADDAGKETKNQSSSR